MLRPSTVACPSRASDAPTWACVIAMPSASAASLPGLPGTDAADALGIAITHAHVGKSMARLGQATVLARGTRSTYRGGRTR